MPDRNLPPSPRRSLSRRMLFKIGALGAGTTAGAAVLGVQLDSAPAGADAHSSGTPTHDATHPATHPPAPAAVPPSQWPAAAAGTTLHQRLVLGTADAHGYRKLHVAKGEPTLVRTDLVAHASRSKHRTPLLAIAQLTDTHVIDAQSPNRFSYLAQYVTARTLGGSHYPQFGGVFRPWEMLTAHVADSMIQAVTRLAGGPVTGRPLDFTITTGDNADSAQRNEIRWHIDLLDGQTVRPDSGDLTRWEGVAGRTDSADWFWHPDGGTRDMYLRDHGFPTVPGLLDRCRAPFTAHGVRMPWYAVFGNHDGLPFGMARHEADLDAIAAGAVQRTDLPPHAAPDVLTELGLAQPAAIRTLLTKGPTRHVTPDATRRPVSRKQLVAEYFTTTGTPVGHGFTQHNVDKDIAYYAFSHNGVRCISLDTVNPAGYFQGSLDPTQFAWLEKELAAHSSRHLDAHGRWVKGTGTDSLVLIFSHHTAATMINDRGGHRVLGDDVLNLLLRYPNVVAWVNGHRHVNDIHAHRRPSGWAHGSGLWEITTASHVDWPQQARTVEVVDNGDSVSVFATVLDHAASARWPAKPTSPLELAALARELSVNDPHNSLHMNPGKAEPAGTRSDRNVELLVAKPF